MDQTRQGYDISLIVPGLLLVRLALHTAASSLSWKVACCGSPGLQVTLLVLATH